MNVIFVGVGAIGLPMALQIQKAGHTIIGVDVSEESRNRAKLSGVEVVGSFPSEIKADVIIAMVATPTQLEILIKEAQPHVKGQHWIIMSTVGPQAAKDAGEKLINAGAFIVDAPVTGGTARASTGELVIFAAGDTEALDFVSPVLNSMGTVKVVGNHPGEGQGIKVINQHLCSVHIVAAAEALNLASALNLNPVEVLALVEGGAAGSWMLSDRGPRMLKNSDVAVSSAINIFVKDSGLVADAAKACGAETPLLDVARARYVAAAEAGLGLNDDSRVIETWEILRAQTDH
ncbi:NAD(P)-dependent oxidoreductase [Klebsiella pneumoniae]|uniref:NAD(P)-dependent oxidoreductase n=1 Tax=Klebsiella pneumoniae TaxID=573 RepID=UPI001BAD0A1A|nr:NAD(P)-dependent oxidoreductase [Klebsiella pneumoniae]MBQ5265161.1 NAD(P)-dependent oxidoreductase [Klebsiella pneumoniae]